MITVITITYNRHYLLGYYYLLSNRRDEDNEFACALKTFISRASELHGDLPEKLLQAILNK